MFEFTIYGLPIPQKQTRFSCVNNKPRTWDPCCKDKERIQWQIKPNAPSEPLLVPIKMEINFYLPIPKGTSNKIRSAMLNRVVLPSKKPDIDNLGYLITNSLKNLVYKDDSQIVVQILKKFYDIEPRTVIFIKTIEQSQKVGYQEDEDII